jgi:hypothetical protein
MNHGKGGKKEKDLIAFSPPPVTEFRCHMNQGLKAGLKAVQNFDEMLMSGPAGIKVVNGTVCDTMLQACDSYLYRQSANFRVGCRYRFPPLEAPHSGCGRVRIIPWFKLGLTTKKAEETSFSMQRQTPVMETQKSTRMY